MSYNDFIVKETSALNDDRSSIEYDFGDHTRYLASFLNPFSDSSKYSREGMLTAAQKAAEKAINRGSSEVRGIIEQGLGGTKVDLSKLKVGKNETQEDYDRRMQGLRIKAAAATKYAGTENADLQKITDGTSVQQINALTTQQTKANRVAAEEKDLQEEIDRETRFNNRQDQIDQRNNARQDKRDKIARDERRFERNENRKDRMQERLLNAENNAMNLQFKYAQLAQSERARAQERKDRAIMTLISGLGNLGAAFAV